MKVFIDLKLLSFEILIYNIWCEVILKMQRRRYNLQNTNDLEIPERLLNEFSDDELKDMKEQVKFKWFI